MTVLLTTVECSAHAGGVPDAPDPEVPAKPTRRRFTAAYKLAVLAEYDAATEPGAKGALLRREGLYSSHLIQWRRARDTGALQALDRKRGRKPADERQAEIARLRRRLERSEAELTKARKTIDVQAKLFALLEALAESAEPTQPPRPGE
jgi:transposase